MRLLCHDYIVMSIWKIIEMTKPVAVVLPLLLAVAAIGSQFSAAVADDTGAGGLFEDITRKQLSIRHAYLLILLVTITLTWATDVNAIIAYASRAFALFYMFQCIVAFMVALQHKELSHPHTAAGELCIPRNHLLFSVRAGYSIGLMWRKSVISANVAHLSPQTLSPVS